ncbi:SurA N-terminal domain-containing protein, partial [Campylobacter jejuni]
MQQMRRQVLSQLIDNMLLDQYAKKLGLAVSDDQIKDAIRKAPYFQTNGQFDNAKYLDLIGRMGYTADNFAQSMRQQLVNQ